jgi:ribosomal protein S2
MDQEYANTDASEAVVFLVMDQEYANMGVSEANVFRVMVLQYANTKKSVDTVRYVISSYIWLIYSVVK